MSALLTDSYQLSMIQTYLDHGMNDPAVFEFFVRRMPPGRNFLIAAGLEQTLDYLKNLHFTPQELQWLSESGRYKTNLLAFLEGFHFTGEVLAMNEGTVFFPNEPILQLKAPLPQAQLVETRIVNLLHFQTLLASKAVRSVLAARNKMLIDFGLRRAHGAEAGLLAARASFLAGFDGTSTVQAGLKWGIPVFGTMAHSYIQAHDSEEEAFQHFAQSNPKNVNFLIDTYHVNAATQKVVKLAPSLQKQGIQVRSVRIDSGNLQEESEEVRRILDQAGLKEIQIFVSGNLNEFIIHDLLKANAPIDGFGVGTQLTTSADTPFLDCAYKLVEYANKPRRKYSPGKATLPGAKQVFRYFDPHGKISSDLIGLRGEGLTGIPLLRSYLENESRIIQPAPLTELRQNVRQELASLPERLRVLDRSSSFSVQPSPRLRLLIMDSRLGPSSSDWK